MSEGGEIFSPTSARDLYREAELMTLRQMSASLATITNELIAHRESMGTMKEDIAVIKVRQEASAALSKAFDEIKAEIELLKARNLRQDGAYSFVTILKDFGPWLVSLIILAWGLFERQAK